MKYIIKSNEPDSFVNWKIRKRLTQSDLEGKSRIQDEYKELWEKFKKDRQGQSNMFFPFIIVIKKILDRI